MTRIHIGLEVSDIDASTRFYTTLFGVTPSVIKEDYAKWMLDDPKVNFSISTRCDTASRIHLGLQVESADELVAVTNRLKEAGQAVRETPQVTCCYHESDKTWTADPEGMPWETFFTHGPSTVYGDETLTEVDIESLMSGSAVSKPGACCGGDKTSTTC